MVFVEVCINGFGLVMMILTYHLNKLYNNTRMGYWRQRADKKLNDPPPKMDPGAFSDQRHPELIQSRQQTMTSSTVCQQQIKLTSVYDADSNLPAENEENYLLDS